MATPRSNAAIDQNWKPSMIGVSSVDGVTPVALEVDPTTGRLLTNTINPSNTIKFAAIAAASSGDNQIVAAVTAKKIKLLSCALIATGAVSMKWRSNTTDLGGLMALAANSGFIYPASAPGLGHYIETAVGEALNINLSGAIAVDGHLSYFEE